VLLRYGDATVLKSHSV